MDKTVNLDKPTLSLRLADHVLGTTFDDLSAHTVEVTKRSILDAVGVTLAASSLGEASAPFIEMARESQMANGASVIGYGFRASPAMAAFANGSMAHSLDYEDTYDAMLVHPNAAIVPAALALAETTPNVDGRDLITAVAIGSDLQCRLVMAMEGFMVRGFGVRHICGAVAAAATSGKLLGLNREQMVEAFALALYQGSYSSEAMTHPASHMRAVREAFAAKAGVISARLAKGGIRAFDQPFEAKHGLFGLYSEGQFDEKRLFDGLGEHFEGSQVSFKPWPSCRGTHSFVEAALALSTSEGIEPKAIKSIHTVVSPFFRGLCEPVAAKRRPTTAIAAKFSIPFSVATAFHRGGVGLASFLPEAIADREVLALADLVDHRVEESWPTEEAVRGILTLQTHDGRSFTKSIETPLGHPANPMSADSMKSKFEECASFSRVPLAPSQAQRIASSIGALESMAEVSHIFAI